MSKPLIKIEDFTGWIANDTTNNSTNSFEEIKWVDLWREPWTIQQNRKLEATVSTISENVLDFVEFNWKTYSWNQDWELYESSNWWVTWTLVHTNTNTDDIWDVTVYWNYLYYTSNRYVWRFDWTTWNDTFKDLGTWTHNDVHIFKIFQNRLYVSDGNVLFEMDSTETWADDVFTIRKNEEIVTIEVLWNELAMWTLSWRFYLWDWSSENASQIIQVSIWGIYALIEHENTLFAFAWVHWAVYQYTWADFVPVIQVPDVNTVAISWLLNASIVKHWAVRRYKNGFIFWLNRNGIYIFNRIKSWDPYTLVKYWDIENTTWDDKYRALWMYKPTIYNEWLLVWHSETWGIDYANWGTPTYYNQADTEITTWFYDVRDVNSSPTFIQWVWIFFRDWGILSKIKVFYKLDTSSIFTEMWEITKNEQVFRGINKRASRIKFKFQIWQASAGQNKTTIEKIYVY